MLTNAEANEHCEHSQYTSEHTLQQTDLAALL